MTEFDPSPLNKILDLMGAGPGEAARFAKKLKTSKGIQLGKRTTVFINGIAHIIDETGKLHLITIHIKNQKTLSRDKIRDIFDGRFFALHWTGDSRRIHLGKCRTIERMIAENSFHKYHGSQNENHIRQVLTSNGNHDVPLSVCLNCIRKFVSNFPLKQKKPKEFDFVGWLNAAQEIGKRAFPDVQPDTKAADDYPKDWPKISREYKNKTNWTCECCSLNLRNSKQDLHTHHINNRKSDCAYENLEALCKLCHGKRHKMRVEAPYLTELREKQGLERYCPTCRS